MAKSITKLHESTPGISTPLRESPWLYNPWLDLLVGCGAWSAPLLLFWYLSSSAALAWSATFYGLAIFFNYPHYMATLYRAYHTSEDFRKYRIFTVHITALILLTLILSHFWYRALPWLFTIYLTWSPWHYSGQNYGLFMMFARRAGAKPSENERQSLYSAFLCSYLILFLTFHTGASQDPLFISLGIPEKISLPIIATLAIAFIVFSTFGLSRLGQKVGWRGLLPSLTVFSTQFLWFLLPTGLTLAEGLRITQSRYSNGVLAVMHSAQYLWITSYYARREAKAGSGASWRAAGLFRRVDRWRNCVVYSRTMDRQPGFSLRFHGQLFVVQRVGQYSSLHSGWCDLETARWPHRRAVDQLPPADVEDHLSSQRSTGGCGALVGGQ